MRRDHDTVESEQRRVSGGLHIEHVERGTSDHTSANSLGERRLVHDAAAGNVDHSEITLRARKRLAADQSDGLLGLGQVHREEVGLGNQILERQHLDVHLLAALGRHEGIVGHEAHAERLGAMGNKLANAAEPDDAEGLVREFHTLPLRALPSPRLERSVCLGHVAGLGEQQRHRVLRGRHDVALRCVHHHHAALGCCGHVDVVETDTCPTHHDEVGGALQHLGSHLGGGPDDECVGTHERCGQRFRREVEPNVNGVTGGPKAVEAALGDFFGDKDTSHGRQ
ncbi:unannotated protein [freshwater metagenome]|uniref:Unannotated protein n=1 Tax=freshwater metagenome TaxID=449393 RepID=A0A6J6YX31_9ZZZZ